MIILSGYAGILGLIYIVLSYRVSVVRRREKVSLGDAGNEDLTRVIRAHANFAEYVPISLILMALIAQATTLAWPLHLSGAVLVVARIMHATGLTLVKGKSTGRLLGTLLTWLNLLGLSVMNIILFVQSNF